ncbi:hypothetical protein I3843_03G202900 [Carya illinoinensis]|nr:hypothetical protein I3843_03G202900 [Carya illinoinensis]
MEDTPKRHRYDAAASENTVGVSDDLLAWLYVDEDAVLQLMELLEDDAEKGSESSATTAGSMKAAKVRFIEYPYSLPLIFQPSTSYVTINGNEESCGSSFSESDSSVMASVDMRGMLSIGKRLALLGEEAFAFGEWSVGEGTGEPSEEETRGWSVVSREGGAMDGCDVFEWDDKMLETFLGEDLEQ